MSMMMWWRGLASGTRAACAGVREPALRSARSVRLSGLVRTLSLVLSAGFLQILGQIRDVLYFLQNFRVLGQAGLPRRLAPTIAHMLGAATARKGARVMKRRTTVLASRSPRTIFLFCIQMNFLAQIGQRADPAHRDWPFPPILLLISEIYPANPPIWLGLPLCSKLYLVVT